MYVKENCMLSKEQLTVITSILKLRKQISPEYHFKDKGLRVELNPPAGYSVQWAEKETYREDNVVTLLSNLKGQPVQLCPARRRIFFTWRLLCPP